MHFANLEPLALDLDLPWNENPEQERKFKRLLKRILIVLAILAVIIPWLPVFDPDYEQEQQITKTKVMLEPVVQPEPEPEPEPEPAPKPEPVKPAKKPEPTPKPQQAQTRVANKNPPAPPPPPPKKTKESVMKEQGLSGLSEQLSALRGSVSVAKLQRKNVSKSDLGKKEYSTRDKFGEDIAAKRSQGINVDQVMKRGDISLGDYRGVAVQADVYSDQPGGSQLSFLSDQAGRRDMENIRRTFEAAKSSVYSLYLQALNQHPDLSGKFIFRLVIEPDGTISELELVSSELGVTTLERTILDRIRRINFGAKDVSPTAVEYAFSFLPS